MTNYFDEPLKTMTSNVVCKVLLNFDVSEAHIATQKQQKLELFKRTF